MYNGGAPGAPDSWYSFLAKYNMVNPLYDDWFRITLGMWRESQLRDHWFFRHWAPDVSARDLFILIRDVLLGMIVFHLALLLFLALRSCAHVFLARIVLGSGRPQQMPASGCEKRQMVRDLLEKPKDEFGNVSRKIKPVVALNWPWRGGGLWQAVALLLLDVGLDINTIFTFLATKQYAIAALTSFLVVRSALKQLIALPPWRLRQDCLAAPHSLKSQVLACLACLIDGQNLNRQWYTHTTMLADPWLMAQPAVQELDVAFASWVVCFLVCLAAVAPLLCTSYHSRAPRQLQIHPRKL